MIKKFTLIATGVFALNFMFVFASDKSTFSLSNETTEEVDSEVPAVLSKISLYDSLQLGKLGLTKQAYEYAMTGFNKLVLAGKVKNDNVISIIDFSLASSKKRLFIIDLKNKKLLFNTYVSHGRNSGREMADNFSNEDGSFKSSLGFYITKDTYEGKHGYSMRLNGEERGINDNALGRGIVMHSASYVDESLIRSQGYIGRSQGCPAISEKLHKPIIDKIKNGTCFFMYSPDRSYASRSNMVKQSA